MIERGLGNRRDQLGHREVDVFLDDQEKRAMDLPESGIFWSNRRSLQASLASPQAAYASPLRRENTRVSVDDRPSRHHVVKQLVQRDAKSV